MFYWSLTSLVHFWLPQFLILACNGRCLCKSAAHALRSHALLCCHRPAPTLGLRYRGKVEMDCKSRPVRKESSLVRIGCKCIHNLLKKNKIVPSSNILKCNIIGSLPRNQGRSQRGAWGPSPPPPREQRKKIKRFLYRSTKYGCVHSKTFKYFCVYTKRSGSRGGRGGCMVSRMEANQRRPTGSREINV